MTLNLKSLCILTNGRLTDKFNVIYDIKKNEPLTTSNHVNLYKSLVPPTSILDILSCVKNSPYKGIYYWKEIKSNS